MLCTVKLFVWRKLCVCWSALSSWGQQELDRDKPPFFYHLLCCFYQLPKWISVRISWISPGQHKRIFILSFWGCFWAFHLRALYEVLFFTPRAQWISKEWIFNVIYRFLCLFLGIQEWWICVRLWMHRNGFQIGRLPKFKDNNAAVLWIKQAGHHVG